MRSLFLILLIQFSITLTAQHEHDIYLHDPGSSYRENNIDIQHQRIEVTFDTLQNKVFGEVLHNWTVKRNSIDSIILDAPGITIKSVKIDRKPAEFRSTDESLIIYVDAFKYGTEHSSLIKYETQPKRGIYYIGWDDETRTSRRQIWTQGQGRDNRHWIPSFDHPSDKLTTEMIVEFDANYFVLSNGKKLQEKEIGGGNKRWHYKMEQPHLNYLIMLTIGKYKPDLTKVGTLDFVNYYYPELEDRNEYTYAYSKEIMEILQNETGVDYPWGKTYSQIPVQDFLYGAMENTTATIFGDFFVVDERSYSDRNYVNVNAHELAHQWFGDFISMRNWRDIWLHESFATHYAKLCEKEIFGEEYYQWVKYREMQRALEASAESIKPIAHSSARTARIYPKGSFVLDMLKDVIGREDYNRAVKYYLEKYAFQNVTTEDFMLAFHEALGYDLSWFFNQWILHGGEPEYKVRHQINDNNSLRLSVEQIQPTHGGRVGVFKMPVDIEVGLKSGKKFYTTVMNDERFEIYDLQLPEEMTYVIFDKGNKIIKRINHSKTQKELYEQAAGASQMIDQFLAAMELEVQELEGGEEAIGALFNSASSKYLRAALLKNMVHIDTESYPLQGTIKKVVSDGSVEEQKALLKYLRPIELNDEKLNALKALLKGNSYQLIESALEFLLYKSPDRSEEWLEEVQQFKNLNKGGVGNHLYVSILEKEALYKESRMEENLNKLVDLSSNKYEFRTRVNAFQALGRMDFLNEELLNNMEHALNSFNGRLSGPTRAVLNDFRKSNLKSLMIKDFCDSNEDSKVCN